MPLAMGRPEETEQRSDSLKDPPSVAFYICVKIQRKSAISCNLASGCRSFLMYFLSYCLYVSSMQLQEHSLLPGSLITSGADSPLLLRKTLLSSAAHTPKAFLWTTEQGVVPDSPGVPSNPNCFVKP